MYVFVFMDRVCSPLPFCRKMPRIISHATGSELKHETIGYENFPSSTRPLDPSNGVYPMKNNQLSFEHFGTANINTHNDPFSCQITDFNGGWSRHVADDGR